MARPDKIDHVQTGVDLLNHMWQDKEAVVGLVQTLLSEANILEDLLFQVLDERGINDAIGVNLDNIGAIFGVIRGGMDDTAYRVEILKSILLGNSDGTTEVLLTALRLITNSSYVDFTENDGDVNVRLGDGWDGTTFELLKTLTPAGTNLTVALDNSFDSFVLAEPGETNASSVLAEPGDSSWIPLAESLKPFILFVLDAAVEILNRVLFETPFYMLVQRYGQTNIETQLSSNPNTSYFSITSINPSNLLGAQLYVNSGAGYQYEKLTDFSPWGRLSTDIGYTDTTLQFSTSSSLSSVTPGSLALVAGEFVRVDAVDTVANTITVGRGVLDTVAIKHSVNTYVYFITNATNSDDTLYVEGNSVSVKLAGTDSASASQSIDALPEDSLVMSGRAIKPYPMSNLRVNGQLMSENLTDQLNLEWYFRNRLNLSPVSQDQLNEDPEIATISELTITDGNDIPLFEDSEYQRLYFDFEDEYEKNVILDRFEAPNGTNLTTHSPIKGTNWQGIGVGEGVTSSANSSEIINNSLTFNSSQDGAVIDTGLADCIVEVDYTTGPNSNGRNGIIVRGNNEDNFIVFVVRPEFNDCGINTFINNLIDRDIQDTGIPYTFTPNTTHQLKVECKGSIISAFINDEMVVQVSDEVNVNYTKCGLCRVNNGSNADAFTNFRVHRLPPAGDAYFNNVVALLPFDGVVGQSDAHDLTGRDWSVTGAPETREVDFFESGKALWFDGNNDFIETPSDPDLELNTDEEFTIETEIYLESYNGDGTQGESRVILTSRPYAAPASGYWWRVTDFGQMYFTVFTASSSEALRSGQGAILLNTLYKVAVSRDSAGVWKLWIDGELVDSRDSLELAPNGEVISIGRDNSEESVSSRTDRRWHGYIGQFRWTKGVDRYRDLFDTLDRVKGTRTTASLASDYNSVTLLLQGEVDPIVEDTFTGQNGALISSRSLDNQVTTGWQNVTTDVNSPTVLTTPQIQDGKAYFPDDHSGVVINTGTPDGIFEVDYYSGPLNTDRVNLVLRYVDSSNFLLFNIRTDLQEARLLRVDGGIVTDLVNTSFKILPDTKYRLSAVCKGSAIRCYIDNTLIAEVSEAIHSQSQLFGISCSISSDDFRFNNFRFYSGNVFIDSSNSGLVPTVAGNPTLDKGYAVFGKSAIYFDDNHSYLEYSTPLIPATDDFTLEFRFKRLGAGNTRGELFATGDNGEQGRFYIYVLDDGRLEVFIGNSSGDQFLTTTAGAITPDVYYNVAVVRDGTNLHLFLNGILVDTEVVTISLLQSICRIGDTSSTDTTRSFHGVIDEYRITSGIAKYTSNYQITKNSFPSSVDIDLFANQITFLPDLKWQDGSKTIEDRSRNEIEVTLHGDAQIDTAQSVFDGTSLSLPTTSSYAEVGQSLIPAKSDFTLDFRVRLTSLGTRYDLVSQNADYVLADNYLLINFDESTNEIVARVDDAVILKTGVSSITSGTWYAVSLERRGDDFFLYLNGEVKSSVTSSVEIYQSPTTLFGRSHLGGYHYNALCWFDEIRVTSVSRYAGEDYNLNIEAYNSQGGNVDSAVAGQDVALLRLNGEDGSTNFTDDTGRAWTLNGTGFAATDSVQLFGENVTYFNGSNSAIETANSSDFNLGNQDFTIEGWINPDVGSENDWRGIISQRLRTDEDHSFTIYIDITTGNLAAIFTTDGDMFNTGFTALGPNVKQGIFNHFAIVRKGTRLTCYTNGIPGLPVDIGPIAIFNSTQVIQIGSADSDLRLSPFLGYISNLWVKRGVALYDEKGDVFFNPSINSLLLLFQGNNSTAFADRSDEFRLLTTYGSPQLDSSWSIAGTQSALFNNNSALGQSDPLLPANSDFEIEAYIRPQESNRVQIFFAQAVDGGNGRFFVYVTAQNELGLAINSSSTNLDLRSSVNSIDLNDSYSVAVTRLGDNWNLYLQGNLVAEGQWSGDIDQSAWKLGATTLSDLDRSFNGNIDAVRVGPVRHKGNSYTLDTDFSEVKKFTPSQLPLPLDKAVIDNNYDNVVSYLPLNSRAGDTVFTDEKDLVWTNQNGVSVSSVERLFGRNVAFFNGSVGSAALTTTSNSAFDLTDQDFTIEAWIKPSIGYESSDRAILSRRTLSSSDHAFTLNLEQTTGNVRFVTTTTGDSDTDPIVASGPPPLADAWNHVAVVRRGIALTVYTNGVAGTSVAVAGQAFHTSSQEIVIGAADSGAYTIPFIGYMANVRVVAGISEYTGNYTTNGQPYPVAAEANYEKVIKQAKPVLYYKQDELSGTIASDSSGNGNDIDYIGNPVLNGQALVAGGNSADYTSAPAWAAGDMRSFKVPINGPAFPCTLEGWFIVTNTGSAGAFGVFDSLGSNTGFKLYLGGGGVIDGKFGNGEGLGDQSVARRNFTSAPIDDAYAINTPFYAAVRFNNPNSGDLFINGASVPVGAITGDATHVVSGQKVNIAIDESYDPVRNHAILAAHCAYYDRALSNDEILNHYNVGISSGVTKSLNDQLKVSLGSAREGETSYTKHELTLTRV